MGGRVTLPGLHHPLVPGKTLYYYLLVVVVVVVVVPVAYRPNFFSVRPPGWEVGPGEHNIPPYFEVASLKKIGPGP